MATIQVGSYDSSKIIFTVNQSGTSTSVSWKVSTNWSSGNFYMAYYNAYVNGKQVSSFSRASMDGGYSASGTYDIGSYGSFTILLTGNTWYGTGNSASSSGTVTLTAPKATITATVDFNDEGNPTISFSNPGSFTVKPYLKFYDSSNTLVHTLSRTTGVSSPYTWSISNTERSAIRTATNKQNSYVVEEGIETFNGSTSLGTSSANKTFSIVNATPTASHTLTETDSKVSAVLGTSAATVIKGLSDIKVTVTPSYKKGATAKNMSIKLGNTTLTSSPATFSNVSSSSLSYTVTDSRSNSVTKTATLNVIDYIPVAIESCEFRRKNANSNIVILNAVISVYTSKISNKTNTLTLSYSSSNDNSGTITTYTTGTNKITISNLELGELVASGEVAAFTLSVSDLFTSDTATNNVVLPVPVLDAGATDIQINGTLYVANTAGANKVDILTTLNNVKTTANAAPKVFVQSAQPTATKKGDIWFKV